MVWEYFLAWWSQIIRLNGAPKEENDKLWKIPEEKPEDVPVSNLSTKIRPNKADKEKDYLPVRRRYNDKVCSDATMKVDSIYRRISTGQARMTWVRRWRGYEKIRKYYFLSYSEDEWFIQDRASSAASHYDSPSHIRECELCRLGKK